MRQDVRDLLGNPQPVPLLHRVCVWASGMVLGWILLLILFGGICWWMEVLAGIR